MDEVLLLINEVLSIQHPKQTRQLKEKKKAIELILRYSALVLHSCNGAT